MREHSSFQDDVIVHELLHLRVRQVSIIFWNHPPVGELDVTSGSESFDLLLIGGRVNSTAEDLNGAEILSELKTKDKAAKEAVKPLLKNQNTNPGPRAGLIVKTATNTPNHAKWCVELWRNDALLQTIWFADYTYPIAKKNWEGR